MYHKHLSANKLKVHLTKVRKRPNKEHWRELGSQSIQDVAERIERAPDRNDRYGQGVL